jgi:hypothetical protein
VTVANRSGLPIARPTFVSAGTATTSTDDVAERHVVFQAILQMLLVVAIGIGASLMAHSGLGTPARLLFFAGGLGAAGYYVRRSPWLYLTVCFWFWTLAPCFRRVVDYYAGFDPTSIMLATPSFMTLFTLNAVLNSSSLLARRSGRIGLLLAVPICYGLFVNFVLGDVLPGAVAAADWLVPLLYYFYFLTLSDRIAEAEEHFRIFLTLNLAFIVIYGLNQYFAPTDWDIAWIRDSGLVELGGPLPFTVRLFSTLNMPGPLAIWVSTVLLLALHFRTKLMLLVLPAAGILLLLTLVRSVLGTTAVGLIAAILFGRPKVFVSVVKSVTLLTLVMGGIGAIVLVTDPDLSDRIEARFGTLNRLDYDVSAEARRATYAAAPGELDDHPFGTGIATLGRGAVVAGRGQVVIDAGPVAIYLALGWIGGTTYLIGIILVTLQTISGARASGSPAALALAAATIANLSMLAFDNAMGVQAAILWTCAGYANAMADGFREPIDENAAYDVPALGETEFLSAAGPDSSQGIAR